jgi:multidrug efflux pump subunit AcrB
VNLASWAIRNRVTTLVLGAVMFIGGIQAYGSLARLEDPEFTIKDAIIVTPYPGATAAEVEEEVSDKIEKAIQQLGQLDWIESTSYWGTSHIKAHIKDQYGKAILPQVWDELRRKVGDVQGQLPPGAGPSVVNDDFGDVWGVFIALHGDEYSYAELRDVAKMLQRELLLVKDVAKIDFWGDRTESVYVEIDRDRLSQLGIQPETIIQALRQKNIAVESGRVEVGPRFISIQPSGEVKDVGDFESLLLSQEGAREQIYIRDVAHVRRGYVEPPSTTMRYDGMPAIGLGVSTVTGGNVVEMGEAVEKRFRGLLSEIPLGMDLGIVSLQSAATTTAINAFLVNLVEAVAIVIGVLVFFMGFRSATIIGFILALTICGTFIFMGPWSVALERISLGALVIALGMLVDNAIVVVDGILVRIEKGMPAEDAAVEVVGRTSIPLLGATAVAVMAFGAIGLSNDGTGEYCRSLFQVVFLSLGLSWVTAVTITPVLCVMFLKAPEKREDEVAADPYGGRFYGAYRGLLQGCIRARWLTVGLVLAAFGLSIYGFRYVDNSFFPDSTRPQFMLDMWMPQGTYIKDSAREAADVEGFLRELDAVTHVTSLVGGGGMRFLLTYDPQKNNSAYVQFLVDVEDYAQIAQLEPLVEAHMAEHHPDAMS